MLMEKKNKKDIIFIYGFLGGTTIVFLAILLIPFISWKLASVKEMNIWIYDKTVPFSDYREHQGLVWILNNLKIINSKTKKNFDEAKDYIGVVPNGGKYEERKLKDIVEYPEVIYLADAYGVYTNDITLEKNINNQSVFEYINPFSKKNNELIKKVDEKRSSLIYGGISENEFAIIEKNLKDNLLIGEFNIASSPTNQSVKQKIGNLFGVKWGKWIGRFFDNLNKDSGDISKILVDVYENQYHEEWNFKGIGLVLISENDEIVVLENTKDLQNEYLKINLTKEYKKYKIEDNINYGYWFEFIEPNENSKIVANYSLKLTKDGHKKFADIGLKNTFPAVVCNDSNGYKSFYFAGDFVDIKEKSNIWQFNGFDIYKREISRIYPKSPEYFYWNFYVPIIKNIFKENKIIE